MIQSRRCASSGRKPTFEIIRSLKRKSRSNGPEGGKAKKKMIKRIVRRGAEMDTEDLLHNLAPYIDTSKKICEDCIDRSDESEKAEQEEDMNYKANRIQKPRVHLKVKTNTLALKQLKYCSNRNKIVFPCFDDDILVNTSTNLKQMYHQGVKEEDKDSTDSIIQSGIKKAMRLLLDGVNSPHIRRKVLMNRSSCEGVQYDHKLSHARVRMKANMNSSPQASVKTLESVSSMKEDSRKQPKENN